MSKPDTSAKSGRKADAGSTKPTGVAKATEPTGAATGTTRSAKPAGAAQGRKATGRTRKVPSTRNGAATPRAASSAAASATQPAAEIRTVPLDSLEPDPGNVRRTPASDAETAELAASITAVGLITPLGCHAAVRGGRTVHSVIAGGRRLAALRRLAEENRLPASLAGGVPVMIFASAGDDAAALHEISLAENVVRAEMNAADQITAWGRLHAGGMAVPVIAARFGVAEGLVAQRLRLAGVAEPVLDALREGAIGLDVVRAFTLSEDTDRQADLYAELVGEGHVSARAVRRALSESTAAGDSRAARLVGIEAYLEAGGRITRDLFAEDDGGVILHDPDILATLAEQRIDAVLEEVLSEGWKWAEYADGHPPLWEYRMLTKDGAEASDDEAARLAGIKTGLRDADPQDRQALRDEAAAIRAAVDARGTWSTEQLALAGAIIHVGRDGGVVITRGLVRKSDDPELKQTGAPADRKPLISAKLARDLGEIRTQIVQAHMLTDPELASDIVAFNLAQDVLGRYDHIGAVRRTETAVGDGAADLPFADALTGFRRALDAGWTKRKTSAKRFAAFRALPGPVRQARLVWGVASSVGVTLDEGGDDAVQAMAAWRPDAGFWGRISRNAITELVTPVLGAEWVRAQGGEKKAALAERLADIFAGRAKSVTPEQRAAALAWQAPGMTPETASADAAGSGAPQPDAGTADDAAAVPVADAPQPDAVEPDVAIDEAVTAAEADADACMASDDLPAHLA